MVGAGVKRSVTKCRWISHIGIFIAKLRTTDVILAQNALRYKTVVVAECSLLDVYLVLST